MTKEQIAGNAIHAADCAGISATGYIIARMHDILAGIDTEGADIDTLLKELEKTAPAVRVVFDYEQDADEEPSDEEIATAVAEAITGDVDLEEVDHTALPPAIEAHPHAEDIPAPEPVKRAWGVLAEKMGIAR